jgi:hypothetical protein
MKRFRCDQCQTLVVLENDRCTCCGSRLAYVTDLRRLVSWSTPGSEVMMTRPLGPDGRSYQLCTNYAEHNTCNWVVAVEDENEFCVSCRHTKTIPNLTQPANAERWYRLEAAKRRLFVGLLDLGLPIDTLDDPEAFPLVFQFLADEVTPEGTKKPTLTGHDDGLITINIAEADDDERERRRVAMHEPYRTLVGHFRHEVGHYYWDRLIKNSRRLKPCRSMFGDERADYGEALAAHYKAPVPNWQQNFISSYASSHPWEDWAETWAHYLHMVDSLETAHEGGLSLNPRRKTDPRLIPVRTFSTSGSRSFQSMLDRWRSLAYVLNDLNRGLGLQDAYPFVLSDPVIAKLEFVHKTIDANRRVRAKASAVVTQLSEPTAELAV